MYYSNNHYLSLAKDGREGHIEVGGWISPTNYKIFTALMQFTLKDDWLLHILNSKCLNATF